VKCVVWDLDETFWEGTAMEMDSLPAPAPVALGLAREAVARGFLNCVATRNPPSLAGLLAREPWFSELFVDAEVGWEPKSAALRRLADRLELGLDTLAYVDEDAFERAEVESALPEVRTLSLDGLRATLDGVAPAATAEGRRRTELYHEQRRRAGAEAGFAGAREEFLRSCGLRLSIRVARADEAERLAELMERTRQYNSSGAEWPLEQVRARIADSGWLVATVRLEDRFGDYGLVGAAFVDRSSWTVHSLTISCRVAGRGVLEGLIAWLAAEARPAALDVPVRPTERNVPLRLGLRALGLSREGELFHVDPTAAPQAPEWLAVSA
jgi:methoxymalonate biosynthesis protein